MVDLSLLQDFITESLEHLEELESSLLGLEQDPTNREILDDIFRAIHTIKGASQFTGLDRISELSHKLENLLDLLRGGGKELTREITDTLIDTKDRLAQLTSELEQDQVEKSEVADLLARIDLLVEQYQGAGKSPEAVAPVKDEQPENHALEESLQAALDTSILGDDSSDTNAFSDSLSEILDGEPEAATSVTSSTEHTEANGLIADPVGDELIARELSGESYDEELFSIFLKQTGNNFENIRELLHDLPSSKIQDEVLDRCETCLRNMKSSANYMGYTNLTRLLGNWLSQLSASRDEISKGNEISWDFMSAYADQITRVIPQIIGRKPADRMLEDEDTAGPHLNDETGSPATIHVIDENIIKEEVAGEVYDEDLFKIFIQQVQTNVSNIRGLLAEFATAEAKADLLDDCDKNIANLKQAANYMDYSNLLRLYENWQLEIKTAKEHLAANQDVDPSFMESYIDLLGRILPQVYGYPETNDSADGLKAKTDKESPAGAEARSATNDESLSAVDDDSENLFKTLSDSVDAALGNENDTMLAPLHGILEEMLGEGETSSAGEETAEPGVMPSTGPDTQTVSGPSAASSKAAMPVQPEPQSSDLDNKELEPSERRKHERRLGERRKEEVTGAHAMKQTVRVDSRKIDSLMNQVGELVVSRAYFSQILSDLRILQHYLKGMGLDQKGQKPIREISFKLAEATVSLGRVSNELQEGVMKVRMLPVSQLFNRYPRLVRDLIHKTDKKVELVIKGEETELDKMVIEEISDPLIHIIRNAVDHGIEPPEERIKAGKPPTSTLTLEAYHESNHMVIEITDDGRGIDTERIKAKALEKGLIGEQEASRMSDAEAKRFIMMPGFSTAEKATETSGRGVGMDVIKNNIEKLNGTVEIDSEFGVQTRIRIKIPLTLAIIQALLIRVGPELYTIPLSVVEETLRIYEHETSVIEGVEVIHLRDATVPIFKLADLFGVKSRQKDIDRSFVVIVTTGMQRIGLIVDELIGQEEVVIKPLVDYLREESGFSGATIIGDGRISLILDIYELVKITSKRQVERYKNFAERNKRLKNKYQEAIGLEYSRNY